MVPDLRKRRNQRTPLPSWLRGFYLLTILAVVGSGVLSVRAYNAHTQNIQDIQELTAKNESANREISNLNGVLSGQAASRAWNESVREWAAGSTATSSLQAATLLSVIEAQTSLAKEAAMRMPTKGAQANRPVSLSIQSMSLSVRAEGMVDMVLDLSSTGLDSKRIIGALSSCLSTHTPTGFILSGVKPEERANAGRYFITWKKTSYSP